jgi:hypothetical protein
MARTAAKKQAPQKFEEPDDAEGWEDAVVDADEKDVNAQLRLRDWRDVERYREMRELRRLVDDDYGLEEIFHIPIKPRAEPGIPAPRSPARGTPAAPAARPVARGTARPGPAAAARVARPSRPPATPRAKAKRR